MRTLSWIAVLLAAVAMMSCGNNGAVNKSGASGVADSTAAKAEKPAVRERIVDTISIAMNGDVMTGSIKPRLDMPPNDGRDIFIDCAEILKSADVACGNLEGAMGDDGKVRKAPGRLSFSFLMPTKSVKLLVDAGYDFMGIANNHINDFYEEGVQSTIKTLRDNGIGVAGTKDCETCVKEINGVKYGFCAFGHEQYSLRTQDTTTVKRIVKQLRQDCDIVIVCFHGGSEGRGKTHLPNGTEYFHGANRGNLREFAHLCIDNGADIVYGHGPHVCRAMELYKGHLIAYSLGNFATPRGMSLGGVTSYAPLLVARIDGNGMLVDGKIHSFLQYRDKGPRRDAACTVARSIKKLSQQDIKDNQLIIADDGTISVKRELPGT